jgi:FtsH-binding integral membrane protein
MAPNREPLDSIWRLRPALTGEAERRRYLVAVYLHMAGAVTISAAAAFYVAHSPTMQRLLFTANGMTAAGWIATLAPIALALFLGGDVRRLSAGTASAGLTLFAALLGLSLSSVLTTYSLRSAGISFFAAGLGFLALATLAARTRLGLGPLQRFLTIALVGLIVSLTLNLFARSSVLDLLLTVIGVFVFAGLSMVDVQRIVRLNAQQTELPAVAALALYLDLVNIWLSMIRLAGRRR